MKPEAAGQRGLAGPSADASAGAGGRVHAVPAEVLGHGSAMHDTRSAPPADARLPVDAARRFGGVERLWGAPAAQRLRQAHVAVVGLGGVGSWAVEALVRSGVGRITLIDLDHVAESNINRQLQALDSTLGQSKGGALLDRIHDIHPDCEAEHVDDFLTPENAGHLLPERLDAIIDAVDDAAAKIAMACLARTRGQRLVMCGGAGGKAEPARVRGDDLARSIQDPLLSRVRHSLRRLHGFERDPRRRMGVHCIYSDEPVQRAPADACGVGLNCGGFGSLMPVTATVGLQAATWVMQQLIRTPPAP